MNETTKVEIQPITFKRYLDLPQINWIVEGIVGEGQITTLFSTFGLGKTSLILQMFDSLSRNLGFFTFETNPTDYCIIEQDEGNYEMASHVRKMLPNCPALENLSYPNVYISWNEETEIAAGARELRALTSQFGITVIDSLSSMGIKDINHPSMGRLFDMTRQAITDSKHAVVFLHHCNRRGEILGSVQILNKSSNIVEVSPDGLIFHKVRGEVPHVILKKKVGKKQRPFYPIKQNEDSLIFEFAGEAEITAMVETELTQSEAIDKLSTLHKISHNAARMRLTRSAVWRSSELASTSE